MVDMEDRKSFIWGALIGFALTIMTLNVIAKVNYEDPTYAIVEDNAVETIISIKQGDDLTLLNINRYEDGGGLWEVTYDGKSEPVTRRVE